MAAGGTSNSMLRTWFLVVGIWLLYLFRQQELWFSPQHDALVSGGGIPGWKSPLLQLDSDFDPSRLIFLISMGEQAKESKMVERFVWSARHRGQWNGYILLLTDAPIERYARFSQRFVVMNPQDEHFDKRFKDDMPYKRFKTRIIDYTNRDKRLDKVQLIYYLDVDNIVGNSLPDMFDDLESKYNIPNTENTNAGKWLATIPRVWFFVNKYKDKSVQGGQFIVDRKTSGRCLKAWRDKIDANITEAKDQPALHKIRGNGRNQECQIITMMSKSHIVFPTNKTIHRGTKKQITANKLRLMITITYILLFIVSFGLQFCCSRFSTQPSERSRTESSKPTRPSCTSRIPVTRRHRSIPGPKKPMSRILYETRNTPKRFMFIPIKSVMKQHIRTQKG